VESKRGKLRVTRWAANPLQSRESSEAAKRSAAAAERTIAFMKQQHEEQLSLGPQVVLQ
jgi:hypothetical protein